MKKINKISVLVVVTFTILMIMSMITSNEQVMLFMGDTKCDVKEFHRGHEYVLEHWHYSWTHWLYIIMGVCLVCVQIARVIIITEEED